MAAARTLKEARSMGCRLVDVLMGLVAPLLYQIGEEWERGVVTVDDEHRFTAFCEALYELVAAEIAPAASPRSVVLAMNAPDNHHTLGIRLLALWLLDRGVGARVVLPTPSPQDLVGLVLETQPRVLMISLSLAQQQPKVATLIAGIAKLPERQRPRILIGGSAVKRGAVAPIQGAELVWDLPSIESRLWGGPGSAMPGFAL